MADPIVPAPRIDVVSAPHPKGGWFVSCELPDWCYTSRANFPSLPEIVRWDTEEQSRAAALLQGRLFMFHRAALAVQVIHNGNEILTLTLPES